MATAAEVARSSLDKSGSRQLLSQGRAWRAVACETTNPEATYSICTLCPSSQESQKDEGAGRRGRRHEREVAVIAVKHVKREEQGEACAEGRRDGCTSRLPPVSDVSVFLRRTASVRRLLVCASRRFEREPDDREGKSEGASDQKTPRPESLGERDSGRASRQAG